MNNDPLEIVHTFETECENYWYTKSKLANRMDCKIQTDCSIHARKPDIVSVNKKKK